MAEDFIFSALVIKKQSLILFLLRLPAFIPWIFVARGWFSLNEKDSLTNTEADILGTGGEIAFFLAVSITPLITVTGARWFAPLRRWYGIMFMLIGSRTRPPRPFRPTSPVAFSAGSPGIPSW
jgi:hypothetical protein